jgi:hypothetical protein
MNDSQDRADLVRRLSDIDTSTLPPDGGEQYNRLIFETSPYLLQHATNPVDWYPWGQEAFDKAAREDKPLLVSIGYSTCHWCHVMEQESFEDPEVALVLNRLFVPVKVDREERPDIDHLYMTACQIISGGGGWPLNVFLTCDKTPFFATTYLPRRPRGTMPGIITTLERIGAMWHANRDKLLETGHDLHEALLRASHAISGDQTAPALSDTPLRKAYQNYLNAFDEQRGGFGKAPKFPMAHNLSLLLRIWQRFDLENARAMATRTLQHIRLGGVYDHIGFGVHRYAVDAFWRVPHFEKMLYDQALLALAALDAFQATGDAFFNHMADEILQYVLRDLSHPDGGFCCGEDADSEDAEGTFYLWTPDQVMEVLGQEHATIFCHCYEISEQGNFEGKNIPRLEMDLKEWAQWFGVPVQQLGEVLALGRQKLFEARQKRTHPHRDDKVLVSWNGLTIAALARAATLLDHDAFLPAATRAADFILSRMRDDQGRLLRRYRSGQAGIPGFLEDYAGLIFGLLELYQAGFENRFLAAALTLTRDMRRLFREDDGLYYDSGADAEQVLLRHRTLADGAMPAGNSMAALVLLRLAALTADDELEQEAKNMLKAAAKQWQTAPAASALLLTALDDALGPREVLVLAAAREDTVALQMLQTLRHRFRPHALVLWQAPDDAELPGLTPLTADKKPLDGKATAYLCRDRTCLAPVTDPEQLAQLLQQPAARDEGTEE